MKERNSLRRICRIFSVSLTWLLGYLVEIFAELPSDLNFRPSNHHSKGILLHSLEVEKGVMWTQSGLTNPIE